MIDAFVVASASFGRNILGIAARPYETYRRIATKGHPWELLWLGGLFLVYAAAASLVMPSREFGRFFPSALGGYLLSVAVFWVVGSGLGGKGKLVSIALGWAYTLLPTLFWFLATSALYVVLPPPRTASTAGVTFSILYLIFSTVMFVWKVTLGYLTLRFGLKLDLSRIAIVAGAAVLAWSAYSVWMYRLGIFRVPFL